MATLIEALYNLPTQKLKRIAYLREVDSARLATAKDKWEIALLISHELMVPSSVVKAILRCNARQLRLIQLITSLNQQSVSRDAVVQAAGGEAVAEAIDSVLRSLEEFGLAISDGESVLVPDSVRHHVPTSLSDRYSLRACLHSYDAPAVRRIVERLELGSGTKAVNIDLIARHLLNLTPEVYSRIITSRQEADVLEYLLQAGGAATAIEVSGAVTDNSDDFFRYDWQNRWKLGKEKNAIDRLLSAGVIYVISYAYGFNLFLVVPGDLMRVLTGESRASFWISDMPEPTAPQIPPDRTVQSAGLIRDAVSLFGYVSVQEATRTNTGYIHKSSLKNIARTLSTPDERYASFLYAVCRQADLIAPGQERQTYELTDDGRWWLHASRLEQVTALFEAWRDGDVWGEMFVDPLKRGNEYRDKPHLGAIRTAALEAISRGGREFIDLDSVINTLSFRRPLLLSHNAQVSGSYVDSPTVFVNSLIGECLYWLGLVELGWSVEPEAGAEPPLAMLTSFRLTPEGAYLLGVEGAEVPLEPPTEQQFILQANSEVYLPPYLDPSILLRLLLITETPGKAPTGGIVSLTRESIRRALDNGIGGEEILQFLRNHARMGIPQNVEYLINEVTEKHGHIHVGRAQMYIHVDSPIVLKELQARRELKGYIVRTLGDNVAILNASEPDKLLKELRKAGYLPISDDTHRTTPFQFGTAPPKRRRTEAKPSSSNTGRRSAGAQYRVDWDRIGREDGEPQRSSEPQPLPTTRPDDAIKNADNIRDLMVAAVSSSVRVQVAYLGIGAQEPHIVRFEPHRLNGGFVIGWLPDDEAMVTFNINRIAWARGTTEVFVRSN